MTNAISYFDARVMLGPGDWTTGDMPVTGEALLATMDHYGVHEALVMDSLGEAGDAEWGNRQILERTKAHPRLHPVWTLMPPQTSELPPPQEIVAQMRELGVAAAWLPYGAFDIPLEEWCLGSLLDPLEEARVPVFMCPTDRRNGEAADTTDWSGIVRLCQAHPELPVVVTESRIYKSQRALIAALDACPNLHIDVSTLWLHRLIEFLCQQFGAQRLLWASQLPYRDPGATLMQLNCSEIGDDGKALIAGDNLRRLVSWDVHVRSLAPSVSFPEPIDSLHRAARDRADLSGESFYDCHGHIGGRGQRHLVHDSPEELVHEMDRLGLRVCCLFAWITQGDIVTANQRTFDAAKQFPDRFVGFTALNPNHGEDEMRHVLQLGLEHGMRGIKLVNTIHGYPSDGPLIHLACQFAHDHQQFILNHVWGSADLMKHFCQQYPSACFITGHSDARYVDLVKEVDNLYICTCPFLRWGQTEEFVRLYGADRILFGSDLLDLPIAWGYGPIFYAKIPEPEKRLMLSENLRDLL